MGTIQRGINMPDWTAEGGWGNRHLLAHMELGPGANPAHAGLGSNMAHARPGPGQWAQSNVQSNGLIQHMRLGPCVRSYQQVVWLWMDLGCGLRALLLFMWTWEPTVGEFCFQLWNETNLGRS